MKCYGIVPGSAANSFQSAVWLTLASGSVLLMQDTDYTAFTNAVRAAGGNELPMFYDPTPLTSAQITALAPISIPSGTAMLQFAASAAALNPLLSL